MLATLEKDLFEEKAKLQNRFGEIQHREQEISLLYEHVINYFYYPFFPSFE